MPVIALARERQQTVPSQLLGPEERSAPDAFPLPCLRPRP